MLDRWLICLLQSFFRRGLQLGRSPGVQRGTIMFDRFLAMLLHVKDASEIEVRPAANLAIAGGGGGALEEALGVIQFAGGNGDARQHEERSSRIFLVAEGLLRVVFGAIQVATGQRALGEIDQHLLALALANQLRRTALEEGNGGGDFLLLFDIDIVQPVGIGLVEADFVAFKRYQLVIKIPGQDKALPGGIPGELLLGLAPDP